MSSNQQQVSEDVSTINEQSNNTEDSQFSNWSRHVDTSTGEAYYFNSETNESTYTPPHDVEQYFIKKLELQQQKEKAKTVNLPNKPKANHNTKLTSKNNENNRNTNKRPRFQNTDSENKSQQRSYRSKDRPKRKMEIPDCHPWILVFLKSGRRFVHNVETKKSLWNAPPEVQRKINQHIHPDEILVMIAKARGLKLDDDKPAEAREKQSKKEEEEKEKENDESPNLIENEQVAERQIVIEDDEEPEKDEEQQDEEEQEAEEAESEEEVEESDSHNENEEEDNNEIDEEQEDMSWIYNADDLEEDDDDEEDIDNNDIEKLRQSKKWAKFKTMLTDASPALNPFSTWDLEYPKVIDDDRYDLLDTMAIRKEAFDEWSRETIEARRNNKKVEEESTSTTTIDTSLSSSSSKSEPKQLSKSEKLISLINTELEKSKDPTIQFFSFVYTNFNAKKYPYYIDFKRKFRKDDAFVRLGQKLADKDREKLYRSFAVLAKKKNVNDNNNNSSSNEEEREKKFLQLLQSSPLFGNYKRHYSADDSQKNDDDDDDDIIDRKHILSLLSDPRFYIVDKDLRNKLIEQMASS